MRRPMANALKQKWKEFVQFCVDYYDLNDFGISKCKCKYVAHKGYVKSKRRSTRGTSGRTKDNSKNNSKNEI